MSSRTSPIARLLLYYVALGAVVALLFKLFPGLLWWISTEPLQGVAGATGSLSRRLAEEEAGSGAGLGLATQVTVAFAGMIGALLLMAPVVWVYMITKQRQGYDQSVVQTMFLLPVTVAGVIFAVTSSQHAIALAFGLGAIVAAVRFRNTLKDTKDTVYVFVAIGVGLAAGTQALALAAVMSVVFNVVVLALWKFNIGNLYADQLGRTERLKPGQALAVGDPALFDALSPDELDEIADRAARLQAYIEARGDDKKKKRFTGLVLVHTREPEPAQRAAEAVLEEATKRWSLAEIVPGDGGAATLEYLVRLKDETLAATLLEALRARGVPHILGAEFRSLKGLKGRKE